MRKIDSFFDTFEKRILFVGIIYFICTGIFAVSQIFLGIELLRVSNYEDVFQLVHQFFVQHSFFGRNALPLLNIQFIHWFSYVVNIITHLYLFEMMTFILNIFFLFSRYKKYALMNIGIIVGTFIILIACFLLAFQSGSINQIIFYLHIIGMSLIVLFGMQFIISCILGIFTLKQYDEAYQIEVIILK